MPSYGYTLMTEQSGPRELVGYAAAAERAGFDFEVMSDHYFPWLDEQGHAPYAWSMLGAVTQVTERVELMTYVTCPIDALPPGRRRPEGGDRRPAQRRPVHPRPRRRGEPQRARRRPRLAAGQRPARDARRGGGDHPRAVRRRVRQLCPVPTSGSTRRRLWDLPDRRCRSGSRSPGEQSMRAVRPGRRPPDRGRARRRPVQGWDQAAGGRESRKIGQLPICWDTDRDRAVERAHEQFRWFGGGWKVNAELPGPSGFAGATQFVRPEDVADSIPCGPDAGRASWRRCASSRRPASPTSPLVQIGDESAARVPRLRRAGAAPRPAAPPDSAEQSAPGPEHHDADHQGGQGDQGGEPVEVPARAWPPRRTRVRRHSRLASDPV